MKRALCLVALALCRAVVADEPLTPKDEAAARKLYVAKCAKCHKFYDPTAYTETDWRRWMGAMSRKAKLKPSQDQLLNRYLDHLRAQSASNRQSTNAPAGSGTAESR